MTLTDFKPTSDLASAETLPARWYTDPAFLELEKERIFWQTWQPVGTLDAVARPGDFFTADVLSEPLVITRGKDGTLRAFSNVCRHRAGPVAAGRGNRKSLQCRYHGWVYGLDGKLITAPEFEGVAVWQKEEVCLPQIAIETFGPFVFVNLADDPPPLIEHLGAIPAEIDAAGFDITRMTSIERRDYIVEANWKVYIDNYLEGYHIPIAHPGLFREVDYDQYRVDTSPTYSKQHAPIRENPPQDGHGRDRRLLRTAAEEQALYYWIWPNYMLNLYPDNMSINIIIPLDHRRTLTIFEWFFEQPGTGEGWESMQQSIAFSDEIQYEDIEICETVQKGLESRTYDRGRFSVKRENGVHHFQTMVYEALKGGVPS